ncbi:methylenetetrahydrofolate reduct [Flammula alnicola]|nr:methylenetetrahydrofolate reduct [Flammula alnicola]
MKLSDLITAQDASKPFYTFEFFPPRTDQGFENLMSRISRLSALNPLAISVTWGAGGSTKDRSLELAGLTQSNGLNTILHLTCTNMQMGLIDEVLKALKEQGIQNILALRGDPPRGKEEWIASDPRFTRAADLVAYIRSVPEYSSWFCVGVAGYPDGHADSPMDEDTEIDRLKEKVDAGADFIITQLFYDVDHFCHGITVPVIPGIMPIQTYSSFTRVTKLSTISHDDQEIKEFGEGGIQGFHFCTLNLEKSVQRVLEALDWAGSSSSSVQNKLIAEPPGTPSRPIPEVDGDFTISPSNATNSATMGLSNLPTTDGEAGRGELNNAASWDDFPNGRFGDFKNPWGGSGLRSGSVGQPKKLEDLTQIFVDYLQSKISNTPFSPTPLSPESLMILSHLEQLTNRGWWTVGSQPAVNGASSTDEVVGWGPRAGYVFQKCFVEFFCEEKDLEALEQKISSTGECRTNVPDDGRNAVTWGVFPGKEIVQTTIIERESFLSWKDEAFSILSEWSTFYRPGSEERQLLEGVRDTRWLVNVVHHDYKDTEALWTFLLGSD